jgi:hypothetical protein
MQTLNIASGKVKGSSEIDTFSIRDDKIIEERFFLLRSKLEQD